MQYDVATPEEYLNVLEEDWRKEKLLEIREMILNNAPELDESIRYKMLNFGINATEDYLFALNAQKHYVSFYVGSIEKLDSQGHLLKEFNVGKGCIRVRKTLVLSETRLEEFIQHTINLWKKNVDVYC